MYKRQILLIGNGFDLEHDLPTHYMDFLDFCDKARRIYTFYDDILLCEYKQKNLDNWEVNTLSLIHISSRLFYCGIICRR